MAAEANGGVRAVIFDLGGVLVRRHPERLLQALRAAGCAPERVRGVIEDPALHDAFERGQVSDEEYRARVTRALGLRWSREEFLAAWNSILEEEPEAPGVLDRVRRRHRVAILSNTNAPHERFIRARWPYLDATEPWVSSWRVGLRKPEPAMFRAALERTGSPPEQAVYIDDLPEFVEAGRRLGLRAVLRVEGAPLEALLREAGVAL